MKSEMISAGLSLICFFAICYSIVGVSYALFMNQKQKMVTRFVMRHISQFFAIVVACVVASYMLIKINQTISQYL